MGAERAFGRADGLAGRRIALGLAAALTVILVVLMAGCGGAPAPSKTDESQASAPAAGVPDAANPPSEGENSADVTTDPMTAKIMAPWTGDFDGMAKRRVVRALVNYSKTFYFVDRGDQRGISADALREFETAINQRLKTKALKVQVAIIPVRRDQMLPYLVQGRGDVALGNLTITPERRKLVDFSDPAMTGVREILVTGPSGPAVQKLEDLGGKEVWVRASSSYWEHLQAANAGLRKAGRPEIQIRPPMNCWRTRTSWRWSTPDCSRRQWRTTISRNSGPDCTPDLRLDEIPVSTGGEIAWAFRKDSPKLEVIDAFVKTHKSARSSATWSSSATCGTPSGSRTPCRRANCRKFRDMVELFKKYSDQYGFDWLMVVAQGYQESRLDQNLESPAGAVGVMQVMPTTRPTPASPSPTSRRWRTTSMPA